MTDTPTPPATSDRGVYIAVFAAVLSIMAIAAVGLAYEKWNAPRPTPVAPAPKISAEQRAQMAALEETITSLREEIASIHSNIADLGEKNEAQDTSAIEARIDTLGDEITAAQDATSAVLAEMETKIARATAPDQMADARVAYMLLREQVASGKPYAKSLARLRDALPDLAQKKSYGTLESHAETGIATRATLMRELAAIRLTAPEEAQPEPAAQDASWWQQSLVSLRTMVKIERIGSETSPIATLSAAQRFMKYGEVAEAKNALAQLPDDERPAYEDWMEAAEARLAVTRALHRLGVAILTATPAPETPETDTPQDESKPPEQP